MNQPQAIAFVNLRDYFKLSEEKPMGEVKPGEHYTESDGSKIVILEVDGDLIRIKNKYGKAWVTKRWLMFKIYSAAAVAG